MVAQESGESDRDKALRIKEEGYKKVESSEEEELEPSGAAASAAPVGIEEREEVKEEENKPLPEQPLPTESTEAADQAADSTTAVDRTAETKEEKSLSRIQQSSREPKRLLQPLGDRAAELSPISSQLQQVSRPAGKFVASTQNTPQLRSILRRRGESR